MPEAQGWTTETLYRHFTTRFDENKRALDIALEAQKESVKQWKEGWGFALSMLVAFSTLLSLIATAVGFFLLLRR